MRSAILLLVTTLALFGASPAGANTGGSSGASWNCEGQGNSAGASGSGLLTGTVIFQPQGLVAIGDVSANQILSTTTDAKFNGWAGAIATQPTTAECESTSTADYTQEFLIDYTQVISNAGKVVIPWTIDWTGTNQGGDHASASWTILLDGQPLDSGLLLIDDMGNLVRSGLGDSPTIVIEQLGEGTYRAQGGGFFTQTVSLPMTPTGQIQTVTVQFQVDLSSELLTATSNVTATSNLRNGLNVKLTGVNPNLVLSSTPFLAAVPTPQTKPQQKCINELNKQAAKLTKTTGKEIQYCIKQRLNGNDQNLGPPVGMPPLPPLDGCVSIEGDPRGKKLNTLIKAGIGPNSAIGKKCFAEPEQFPGIIRFPTIGEFSVSTVGEPVSGTVEFFNGDLDSLIQTKQAAPDDTKCQQEVVKGYQKALDTWLKEANKAKKASLAGKKNTVPAGVTDDLTRAISQAVENNKKLEKALAKLRNGVNKKCQNSSLDTIVPGCGATTTAGLAKCAGEEAICRSCNDLNGVDGTSVDCDMLDNNLPDASCVDS